MAFLMKYPKDIEFKNIYLKALEIYNKTKGNINAIFKESLLFQINA